MQGGFCTKSIDDVVPNQSSGGLRAHTVLKTPRKQSEEGSIVPVHNVGWTESKKEVERAKTKILLDAVQEQRAKQQAAGVQRLHDQSLSKKLLRAQNGAQSASFRSRSFSVDYGSRQHRELFEGRARESFKYRLEAHQSLGGAEEVANGGAEDDPSEPTRNDSVGHHVRKDDYKSTPSGSQHNSFKECASVPGSEYDPDDPKETSTRSNPEKRNGRARRESADSGERTKKGSHSFKGAASSSHNWREDSSDSKESSIKSNKSHGDKNPGENSNGHSSHHRSSSRSALHEKDPLSPQLKHVNESGYKSPGDKSNGHSHHRTSSRSALHEKDPQLKHVNESAESRTNSDPILNAQSAHFMNVSMCVCVIVCVCVDVIFVGEKMLLDPLVNVLCSVCVCVCLFLYVCVNVQLGGCERACVRACVCVCMPLFACLCVF
jgi:hypothetical protein